MNNLPEKYIEDIELSRLKQQLQEAHAALDLLDVPRTAGIDRVLTVAGRIDLLRDPIDKKKVNKDFCPAPDTLWLVIVECRYNVIHVCVSGKGFYIPGEEPCWGFSHVDQWIKQIIPPD